MRMTVRSYIALHGVKAKDHILTPCKHCGEWLYLSGAKWFHVKQAITFCTGDSLIRGEPSDEVIEDLNNQYSCRWRDEGGRLSEKAE